MKPTDVMGSEHASVSIMRVRSCGTVMVDGSRWPFLHCGNYLLAHKRLAAPPSEMRRMTATDEAVARAYITRAAEEVATFSVRDLGDISAAMRAEELRCDTAAAFNIGGLDFAWQSIAAGLDLMDPGDRVSVALVAAAKPGARVLRVSSPTVRIVVMPFVPEAGAPGCAILPTTEMGTTSGGVA